MPAGQRVCIVEVGSGSGGTSVVVMAALADLGERIEFVYTDISPQLVAYGRKTYGPTFPFATFRLLDVEKDTEDQVTPDLPPDKYSTDHGGRISACGKCASSEIPAGALLEPFTLSCSHL